MIDLLESLHGFDAAASTLVGWLANISRAVKRKPPRLLNGNYRMIRRGFVKAAGKIPAGGHADDARRAIQIGLPSSRGDSRPCVVPKHAQRPARKRDLQDRARQRRPVARVGVINDMRASARLHWAIEQTYGADEENSR